MLDDATAVRLASPTRAAMALARPLALEARDVGYAEASARDALQAAARAHDSGAEVELWTLLVYLLGGVQHHPTEALALLPAAEAAIVRAGAPPRSRALSWRRRARCKKWLAAR